ncbi:unnamed protein product [Leuciscus chuanchicus]
MSMKECGKAIVEYFKSKSKNEKVKDVLSHSQPENTEMAHLHIKLLISHFQEHEDGLVLHADVAASAADVEKKLIPGRPRLILLDYTCISLKITAYSWPLPGLFLFQIFASKMGRFQALSYENSSQTHPAVLWTAGKLAKRREKQSVKGANLNELRDSCADSRELDRLQYFSDMLATYAPLIDHPNQC